MIAFISDIHSNLTALEAVLADIDATAPDARIWCLGDIVGYAAQPGECLDLVFERCEVVIAGNHDLAVVDDPRIIEDAMPGLFQGGPGAGIELAKRELSHGQLEALGRLEPHRVLDNIQLDHGSARDPIWEYIRTPEIATIHLQQQERVLGVVGHTHMPLLWELFDGADEATGGLMPEGTGIDLTPGVRRVFNPGSVGQPRDRDPRASWAALDDARLTFHRTEYDVAAARATIEAAGLPAETGERLELGW
jgi:diadenosine tetraphosphatase ApaH/serine/threonine PP2A family protein phosphatase